MTISTPRKFALSAGIIPVLRRGSSLELLLLRVYNYWDFPKGIVDRGEEPLEGAMRELHEETAIAEVSFPWGLEYRETPPYSYGKIARYYIGEVRTSVVEILPNPILKKVEHHGFRWVAPEQARLLDKLLLARSISTLSSTATRKGSLEVKSFQSHLAWKVIIALRSAPEQLRSSLIHFHQPIRQRLPVVARLWPQCFFLIVFLYRGHDAL